METPVAAAPTPSAGPPLSLFERVGAIYTKPASAWGGLHERAQWWFPLLIVLLVNVAVLVGVYQRAMLPMIASSMESQVESGQMPPESFDRAMEFMASPAGMAISIVQQVIALSIITFFFALAIWFGVSFVLGKKMTYRWALEVVTWSALITIPSQILTGVLAWFKEDFQAAHVGFGILLPPQDTPSRLMTALGVFLDGIGPLAIWYVAVLILGAAAMSGAPRKSTAWVVGGLYVVLLGFGAALASLQVRS